MIEEGILKKLYIDESRTINDIADRLNCHNRTVSRYLEKYGLACRAKTYTTADIATIIQGYGAELLSEYKSNGTKMKIRCGCGQEFERTYAIIQKYGDCKCYKCSGWKGMMNGYSEDEVKAYLKSYGCELLSEYKDVKEKMKIKCNCGRTFYQSFQVFRNGNNHSCTACLIDRRSSECKLTTEEVSDRIKKAGCRWIAGEYENMYSKLLVSCSHCGSHYSVSLDKLVYQNKIRCNDCSKRKSAGEIYTARVLDSMGIKYIAEKTMPEMKGVKNGNLRFDFYFEIGQKRYAIEVDGVQHTYETGDKNYFNKTAYRERKKNDKLKDAYCIQNQIQMIRIPYEIFRKKDKSKITKNIILSKMFDYEMKLIG